MSVWKWSGESRYQGAFPPVLENFCRAFSPGPTDRPWISEDVLSVVTKVGLALVASVSNRVIARKLEREHKKKGGKGKGEDKTLARNPTILVKRPLIFHGSVHLQIDSSSR